MGSGGGGLNILRHKSWHVYDKNNIERVKKDEENARKASEEKQRRSDIANQENKLQRLRNKNSSITLSRSKKNINLFPDVEKSEKEAKEKYEKIKAENAKQIDWEKKIGILNSLGQSSYEASKRKPWYEKIWSRDGKPSTVELTINEQEKLKDLKVKDHYDPLSAVKRRHSITADILPSKSINEINFKRKKLKKDKKKKPVETEFSHNTQEKQEKLLQLRKERMMRENAEHIRSMQLLGVYHTNKEEVELDERKRKYNNQFHPELARNKR